MATHRLPAMLVALLLMGVGASVSRGETGPLSDPKTALEDYVTTPDDNYAYRLVEADRSRDGYTSYLLRMVSQQWRPAGEARPALWRHWLVLIVPDNIDKDTAALVIGGGSRRSGKPVIEEDDQLRLGAQLAVLSRSAVAVLKQNPEQPQTFPDEPFAHTEDVLVAYSWDKAIQTGDYSWPVYLPMTKAAVRAMDTIQDFFPTVEPATIDDFVVIGGSKRGAVAWLTAAIDDRIRAVAPMVIDILNFDRQMEHHLAVYGAYAPAIEDYVAYDLVQRVDTREGEMLRQVVDPISYVDQLDMPKYVLNSTGDQFFPPDSSQFYFGDLPGEKLIRYVPNSDHSLANTRASLLDASSGLFGWYLAIVDDLPRPQISWRKGGDELIVQAAPPPMVARLWQAANPEGRDFRIDTVGEAWTVRELDGDRPGEYAVTVPVPARGWKAFFVELIYPSTRAGICQVYSTRVFVTPDERPFEGLRPEAVGDTFAIPGPGPGSEAPTADDAPLTSQGGFLEDWESPGDDVLGSVLDDVHQLVLDQALGDEEVGDRAIRYCAARDLDDFDEALELYVRLGTGRSVEGFVADQLGHFWDGARDAADDLGDGARDAGDKVIERGADLVGDGVDEVEDSIDGLF